MTTLSHCQCSRIEILSLRLPAASSPCPCSRCRFVQSLPKPVLIVGFITALWLTGLLGVQLYFSFSTMVANSAEALQGALVPRRNDSADGYVTQQELRARARQYSKDGYIILLVCNYGEPWVCQAVGSEPSLCTVLFNALLCSLLTCLHTQFHGPSYRTYCARPVTVFCPCALSLCCVTVSLCAGFHDFFTNWVLHAREFGYDKHFLAVAEDEGSYKYVNEHWPGHVVRVHVTNIEQGQDRESLETAGLKSTLEKNTKGGASAMDTPEFLLIM